MTSIDNTHSAESTGRVSQQAVVTKPSVEYLGGYAVAPLAGQVLGIARNFQIEAPEQGPRLNGHNFFHT